MALGLIAVLVAKVCLATAFSTYRIPLGMQHAVTGSGCTLPNEFEIRNFMTWTPAEGNNRSAIIDFWFINDGTGIETPCHYNSTSVNSGPAGLVPRYSCDNGLVQFVWQDGTLAMVEKACPNSVSGSNFEAAGTLTPKLICETTTANSLLGKGIGCIATQASIVAKFTSLQPTPK